MMRRPPGLIRALAVLCLLSQSRRAAASMRCPSVPVAVDASWETCGAGVVCQNEELLAGPPAWKAAWAGAAALSLRAAAAARRRCAAGSCGGLLTAGEPCATHGSCLTGHCSNGACAPQRSSPEGTPCGTDTACAQGYCNASSLCQAYASHGDLCSPEVDEATVAYWVNGVKTVVAIPKGYPRCHAGIFTSSRTWSIREADDPEYDKAAAPLYCRVRMEAGDVVGRCEGFPAARNGESCARAQAADDVLPGKQLPWLLELTPVAPGYCERGTYPRYRVGPGEGEAVCQCEELVAAGDGCAYHKIGGRFLLADGCVFGAQCAVTTPHDTDPGGTGSLHGTCVLPLDGDKGARYFPGFDEATLVDRSILCPEEYAFDPASETCRPGSTGDRACVDDSDCPYHAAGAVVCDKACGAAAGVCAAANEVCPEELAEMKAFEVDREKSRRELVGGPWGAYVGILRLYDRRYSTAERYTCCLWKEVAENTRLWYHLDLHLIDMSKNAVCSTTFSFFLTIIGTIVGTLLLGSFILILVQDIIPSARAAKEDASNKSLGDNCD
ncbi:hypothetical protein DIPPA_17794 [Diplonema papillatum]|nr:hypothetical protein DIPPA_17794 [Diplonema papillatum]